MNRYLFYRRIRGPVFLLTFGVTALLAEWDVLSFERSWPLYLIVFGVLRLVEGAALAASGPAVVYPTQGYPPQGYAAQGYAAQGYPEQGYAQGASGYGSTSGSTSLQTVSPVNTVAVSSPTAIHQAGSTEEES